MKYQLVYNFSDSYDYFEYSVEQSYDDILEYEFKKTFKENLNKLILTDEQKNFIKDFEYKCNHNKIYYYDYYTTHNFDFLDWLKDKYYYEALVAQENELDEDDFDDWWHMLDEDDKREIYNHYN